MPDIKQGTLLAPFSNAGRKERMISYQRDPMHKEHQQCFRILLTCLPKAVFVSTRAIACYKPLRAGEISDIEGSGIKNGPSLYSQRREITATPTPAVEPLLFYRILSMAYLNLLGTYPVPESTAYIPGNPDVH